MRITVYDILSYLAALYTPLNEIAHTASTVQYAVANAERVVDLLDTAPDVVDQPGASQVRLIGHVRYDDVIFGYEARRPVVHGLTLDVKPGEVVAIVGATGAGKSTLVSLLLRFFDPWSGRITIDGHDVRSLSVKSLRAQIAIVLQESFILPRTSPTVGRTPRASRSKPPPSPPMPPASSTTCPTATRRGSASAA